VEKVASAATNTAIAATSSGLPNRAISWHATIEASKLAVIGVLTGRKVAAAVCIPSQGP
jgi:hypothetical protein